MTSNNAWRMACWHLFFISKARKQSTPNFELLDVLYAAGLRSLGPVWSRSNAFGHGVPFRCPSSPDTGPGLTDLGKELIRACNRLRILIDLSHLNERGFWDVAAISNAPLVATHSNAHALSPHSRNLTDKQLAAIRETGGMVGVNFATSFLRPDGRQDADTPIELVVEHLEHMLKHVGEDGVGFGSDFDGAKIPAGIGNAAGLQNLVEVMRTRGYGEPLIEKLCFRNWLRVLGQTWGKAQNISRTNDCDANKSRKSGGNELGPIIGSKQISDLPMSGLKEVSMAKKKTAKKKTKK